MNYKKVSCNAVSPEIEANLCMYMIPVPGFLPPGTRKSMYNVSRLFLKIIEITNHLLVWSFKELKHIKTIFNNTQYDEDENKCIKNR